MMIKEKDGEAMHSNTPSSPVPFRSKPGCLHIISLEDQLKDLKLRYFAAVSCTEYQVLGSRDAV